MLGSKNVSEGKKAGKVMGSDRGTSLEGWLNRIL